MTGLFFARLLFLIALAALTGVLVWMAVSEKGKR